MDEKDGRSENPCLDRPVKLIRQKNTSFLKRGLKGIQKSDSIQANNGQNVTIEKTIELNNGYYSGKKCDNDEAAESPCCIINSVEILV